MKRKLFTALLAGVMVVSLSTAAFAGASIKLFYNGNEIQTNNSPININGRIYAPVRALAEAMGASVAWDKDSNQVLVTGGDQSMQIMRLESALAPKSSLDAVNSLAEAVKTRNGAWQYALMTQELREASYNDLVAMNWCTGTSSPWIKSYQVKELGKPDENSYFYSVEFTWTDSTNETSVSTDYVAVTNTDGTWLVSRIGKLDVKGEITKVNTGTDNKIESVFVEGSRSVIATYDRATVMIGAQTEIYQGNTNTELKPEALKVGTQVEVVFKEGPMLMIYPPQAEAAVIRVIN